MNLRWLCELKYLTLSTKISHSSKWNLKCRLPNVFIWPYTQVSNCSKFKCPLNWKEECIVEQLLRFVPPDVCGPVSWGCHINKLELFWLKVAMWILWPNKDWSCSMPSKTRPTVRPGTPQWQNDMVKEKRKTWDGMRTAKVGVRSSCAISLCRLIRSLEGWQMIVLGNRIFIFQQSSHT